MNKKTIFLLLILLIPCVSAKSIKLLAVNDATKQGAIVDMNLEIMDGSGKVFIETQPLSQIDTQISLRIAKTIACKISEKYCLDKDFTYSLKTDSPVVAGPSAGAAMALLTMATLENKNLNPEILITGTINSGGVIGTVGSVKEKIQAAANSSVKKVLIPKGEHNATLLTDYGKKFGIDVIEVSNIEDAYQIMINERIDGKDLIVDGNYLSIMKKVSMEMCRRSQKLEKNFIENSSLRDKGLNLSEEADKLTANGLYYSAASRCFGANIYFREALMNEQNLSNETLKSVKENITSELNLVENEMNRTKLDNLGSLETAMIITERIYDARNNIADNETSLRNLGYAIERLYSISIWKLFFKFKGKEIDESKLKESCILKINEVQELYSYVSIYVPSFLIDIKKEFDDAKSYLDSNDYALCLFKASKSEAEINTILGSVYTADSGIDSLLENKLIAAKKTIIKQVLKGNFPILGYSYYEYADVLKDKDKYTALLYAEYGIELSNLDIYFPAKKPFGIKIDERALFTLILGIIIGALLFIRRHYRRKKIILKRKH